MKSDIIGSATRYYHDSTIGYHMDCLIRYHMYGLCNKISLEQCNHILMGLCNKILHDSATRYHRDCVTRYHCDSSRCSCLKGVRSRQVFVMDTIHLQQQVIQDTNVTYKYRDTYRIVAQVSRYVSHREIMFSGIQRCGH